MATGVSMRRLAARFCTAVPGRRCLSGSTPRDAAQSFTMPAMSPTMTEGNIAAWRVKEGESFSAGDVLLEIETDKAQMDVEAQEDGIMFRITQADGAKGVKVGSRIAVLAEAGDDLSTLSVPAEESTSASTQKPASSPQEEETKAGIDRATASGSRAEAPRTSRTGGASSDTSPNPSGTRQKQKYPLYPSVMFALKQNGLAKDDAERIPATGPNGRLLKGDVLSYVGSIAKDYASRQSARLGKLSHLDLSDIKIVTPPAPASRPPPPKSSTASEIPPPTDTEIALPISLSAVIATQKRVRDTLGINLPLSVFIARASELANEELPPVKGPVSADALFDSIVGLDQVTAGGSSRGNYSPNVTGLPATNTDKQSVGGHADVFDEILGTKPARRSTTSSLPPLLASDGIATATTNVFTVTARQGEERRVQAYLERMKLVLEGEPGRLVL